LFVLRLSVWAFVGRFLLELGDNGQRMTEASKGPISASSIPAIYSAAVGCELFQVKIETSGPRLGSSFRVCVCVRLRPGILSSH